MPDFKGIEVPELARGAFRALGPLPESEAAAMVAALGEKDCLLLPTELISRIASAAPSLSEAGELVFALLGLVSTLGHDLKDLDNLADSLSRSPSLEGLSDDQRGDIAKRLRGLLASPCLRLTAKATDVRTEYEHVFADARILTDIRPIFGEDDLDTASAAVIVDTLKLDYYGEDGSRRSLYVALDEEDLEKLHRLSDRALAKSRGMRALLESVKLATWKGEWDAAS